MSSSKYENILKILKDASNEIDAGISTQSTRRNRSFASRSSAHHEEVLVENVPSTTQETAAFSLEVLDAGDIRVVAEEVIVAATENTFDPVKCVEAVLDPMQEAARYFEELARLAEEERHFDEWASGDDNEAFASSSWELNQIVPTEALPASQTGTTETWREYYRSTSAVSVQAPVAYVAATNGHAGTKRSSTPCDSSTYDADGPSLGLKRVRF